MASSTTSAVAPARAVSDHTAVTDAYNLVTAGGSTPESIQAALKSMARVIRKNATAAQREVDAKIAERDDPWGPDSPYLVRQKVAREIREAKRPNR